MGDGHGALKALAAIAGAAATIVGALAGAGVFDSGSDKGAQVRTNDVVATGAASDLSVSAWKHDARAICVRADERLAPVAEKQETVPWWQLLPQVGDVLRKMDLELRELAVPDATAQRIQLMTQDWDQEADYFDDTVTAYANNDRAQYANALNKWSDVNGRGNQIAIDLGIARCADVGGAVHLNMP
jgi:hypothetical protein